MKRNRRMGWAGFIQTGTLRMKTPAHITRRLARVDGCENPEREGSTGVRNRRAVTLTEVIVVIGILGTLFALLVPAIQKVRETASQNQCCNNLKELALGCHSYHDAYEWLPPARVARDGYASWPVLIMPFIGMDEVFSRWDIRKGFSEQPMDGREFVSGIFICPSRRQPMVSPGQENGSASPNSNNEANGGLPGACGDYGACVGDGKAMNYYLANGAIVCGRVLDPVGPGPQAGIDGVDQPNSNPPTLPLVPILRFGSYTRFASVVDGASNTLLLGEKHVRDAHFGENSEGDSAFYSGAAYAAQRAAGPGYPLARDPRDDDVNHWKMFGGPHQGVCMFAFVDGAVRTIRVDISEGTLGYLANRADGTEIEWNY